MTAYAPPDIAARMGRPPLTPKEKTVKTTLRVTQSWLDRIEAVAGAGKTAAFIREAVEAELKRREKGSETVSKMPVRSASVRGSSGPD